jgi:hypothetical protein
VVNLASRSGITNLTHLGIRQIHEQVPGLLHDLRLDGMLRGAQDPDAAGAVLDHGKDVDLGAVEGVGGEEVQGHDPLCLRSQELGPPWTVPARCRVDPRVLEDLPDCGRRHRDAQSRELAVDLPVSPGLVLPGRAAELPTAPCGAWLTARTGRAATGAPTGGGRCRDASAR